MPPSREMLYFNTMKEAMLYEKLERGAVRCGLCSHRCMIAEGKSGICGLRTNRNGTLTADNYEKVVTTHVDPIEKKPLFHYKPGSSSFSIATVGCNFRCRFCQNYDISQWVHDGRGELPGRSISPEALAGMAREAGSATIAFTYTEPTIFAELAYDTARAGAELGIDAVFVTNGYMTGEMIETFGPLLKGANVDLKAFRDESYRDVMGARLEPVLESIRNLHDNGTWLEITTLVVPDFNDSDEELTDIAAFIAGVDPAIPWHISAFHPSYRMTDRGRTRLETLHRALDIGKKAGLRFVFTGNAPGDRHESTFCPACGKPVIERRGFQVVRMQIEQGRCANCGETIEGVY